MEVIKYGLIWDCALFTHIREENVDMSYILNRSKSIKEEIVKKDPFEKGLRRILNFGHSVGHAIEQVSNYSILHGEAIWLGMIIETTLSWFKGYLSYEDLSSILNFLYREGEEIKFSLNFDKKDLYEVMRNDKKAIRNVPRFVALSKIGKVAVFDEEYCTEFSKEEFFQVLDEIYCKEKQNFRSCLCPTV